MAIKRQVAGNTVTYVGVIDISENTRGREQTAIARTTRAEVEWALKQEFTRRLEQLAKDASLLRFMNENKSEDPMIVEHFDKLLNDITDGLWQLRNSEPAVVLCGDLVELADDYARVQLDGGEVFDPLKWAATSHAIETCRARATHDARTGGALTATLRALGDAGIVGGGVTPLADQLGAEFVEELERGKRTPVLEAAVAAHVRVVLEMARTSSAWAKWIEKYAEGDALESPLPPSFDVRFAYRAALERELSTPEERARLAGHARALRRVLAPASRAEKQTTTTIAAKRLRRPRAIKIQRAARRRASRSKVTR